MVLLLLKTLHYPMFAISFGSGLILKYRRCQYRMLRVGEQMAAVGRVTARAAPPNHGGNMEVCVCVWLAGWL